MRTELNISIPEPCHENWDKMLPNQKGRHCQVCEKTVVDFTSKTDESIVKYFLKHNNICGRFKNQQLNRPVVLSRKSKNNYWSFLASGLFGFLSLVPQDSKAQTPTEIIQTDSVKNPTIKGKIAHSILNTKTISGTVLDENGLPLPIASILVKGTQNGTSTDFDGNYTLKAKKGDTLIISYVGYSNKEIIINDSNTYSNNLILDSEIGEITITAGGAILSCYIDGYEYKPTPEEIKEQKHLDSIAKRNNKVFYKQKLLNYIEASQQRRLEKKAKRKKL